MILPGRLLFILLPSLSLAACINIPIPRQPVRQDPFAGIEVEKLPPAFPQTNLALLISENFKNSAAFGRQGAAWGGFDFDSAMESKFALFKNNFKTVARIDRPAEARAAGADLIVLYDSFADVKWGFKLDSTVVFMDLDGKEIERLQAHGERPMRSLMGGGSAGAVQDAINEVTRSLDRGMRASAKLADHLRSRGGAASPVAAAPAPAGEPLRPSYKSAEKTDDFAVVVGIENYANLPAARFAERDAADMAEHFGALGVPRRNIVLLTGSQATLTGLKKNLQAWLPKNVKPSSRVYFYFSGHGAPDPSTGKAYLIPWDGDPSYLSESAYPLAQLYDDLGRLRAAKVVVALDACFSGAGGRSVLAKGARPLVTKVDLGEPAAEKVSLLTAAAGDEITATMEEQGHGMFTYFLLKGLNGGARDSAGRVTVKGLYDYLKPQVQDEARRQNREQTPFLRAAQDTVLRAD